MGDAAATSLPLVAERAYPAFVRRAGHDIATLDWGGPDPVVVLIAGAGLCAGVYEPVARRLAMRCHPIAVDLRGHGASARPHAAHEYSYAAQGHDVVAVLDHFGASQALAFGHSFGGAVLLAAALHHPGRLSRVVTFEAAVGKYADEGATADRAAEMRALTSRRRARWPDRESFLTSIRSRAPYDRFAPEFLAAYARHGLRDRVDGQVELCCSPEVEGLMFTISVSPFGAAALRPRLNVVADSLPEPVVMLVGDQSPFSAELFADACVRLRTSCTQFEGAHFGPFEDVDRAEMMIRRFVLQEEDVQ